MMRNSKISRTIPKHKTTCKSKYNVAIIHKYATPSASIFVPLYYYKNVGMAQVG